MHIKITDKIKEAMNLKENDEGYIGGFGERKRKEEMM